jgi:hypothetical protein
LAAKVRQDSRVHLIAPLPSSHEGRWGQAIINVSSVFAFCSWIRGPSPLSARGKTGRVTSHPVAASDGCTIISHARGIGLGRAEPTLITACRSHKGKRSADPDPVRLIEPRGLRVICRLPRSGRLECGTCRQLAQGCVTPERDQQLACQRHDRDAADAAALRSHSLAEPADLTPGAA